MRIRVSKALLVAALLALPGLLFAATAAAPAAAPAAGTKVILAYHTNDSGTFEVRDATGAVVDTVQDGDTLGVGWTVLTGKGDVAELEIDPTKTIIKIAGGTSFKVEGLRADLTHGTDVFSLASGKIRTVAGKASGKDQYQIKTQSAVAGVRGTDALIEYLNDAVTTFSGTAFVLTPDGTETDINAGFSYNTLDKQLVQLTADALAAAKAGMDFVKLSAADAEAAHQADLGQQAGGGQTTATAPTTPPPPQTNPFLDSIMAKLRDILGMEIGSVTIGGETWAKAVIQPTFTLGKLKASLYLPIIYNGDMFNSNDWYKPEGNNEWSFGQDTQFRQGVDPDYPLGMIGDITSDLFLKIRYLEWGQQRDPFFFKVGNLADITIGHGLIMNNFSNDADFPAVRRVGLNFGLDFGGVGFEAMANDAKIWPDIVGGRLYFRPVPGFKAALGVSLVADLAPGKDWPGALPGTTDPALVGDPVLLNPGVDIDLPFVESDVFSLVAFADAAAMVPYFRARPTSPTYSGLYDRTTGGFAVDAVYDPKSTLRVKNWGFATGLFGNLIIRDFTWRLEFRDYTGSFIPQFYNSGYERSRTSQLGNILAYLQDPAAAQYNQPTLGVFGEGGLTLAKLFSLKLSYFWPWTQDSAGNFTFGNDHFVAMFTLEPGVIPVVNIWGSVSYERSNFVPTIMQSGAAKGLNLFDANTVVSATINYPVTTNLDVTLLYTTTAKRDPVTGNVIMDPASPGGLLPELDTSLAIQTQVHL